jgi:hypothetical protein
MIVLRTSRILHVFMLKISNQTSKDYRLVSKLAEKHRLTKGWCSDARPPRTVKNYVDQVLVTISHT